MSPLAKYALVSSLAVCAGGALVAIGCSSSSSSPAAATDAGVDTSTGDAQPAIDAPAADVSSGTPPCNPLDATSCSAGSQCRLVDNTKTQFFTCVASTTDAKLGDACSFHNTTAGGTTVRTSDCSAGQFCATDPNDSTKATCGQICSASGPACPNGTFCIPVFWGVDPVGLVGLCWADKYKGCDPVTQTGCTVAGTACYVSLESLPGSPLAYCDFPRASAADGASCTSGNACAAGQVCSPNGTSPTQRACKRICDARDGGVADGGDAGDGGTDPTCSNPNYPTCTPIAGTYATPAGLCE